MRIRHILLKQLPALLILTVLILSVTGLLDRLETAAIDLRFRFRGRMQPGGRVAVVGIDSDDLKRQGAWGNWTPDRHALVLHILDRLGAAAIGVDIFFLEKGAPNFTPRLLAESGKKVFTLSDLVKIFPDPSVILAGALGGGTPVILAHIMDFDDNREWKNAPQAIRKNSIPTNSTSAGIYRSSGLKTPRTMLLTNAAGIGFADLFPDIDGVVRRIPLLYRNRDRVFLSLGLMTALQGMGLSADRVSLAPSGSVSIRLASGEVTIPVNNRGEALLNWLGPQKGSIPFISWSAVRYLGFNLLLGEMKKAAATNPRILADKKSFLNLPAVRKAARFFNLPESPGYGTIPGMIYDQMMFTRLIQEVIDTDPGMDFSAFLRISGATPQSLGLSRKDLLRLFRVIRYGTLVVRTKGKPQPSRNKSPRIGDKRLFELVRRNIREYGMTADDYPYYLFPPRRLQSGQYLFPSFFKKRYVMYGLTAVGTQDYRATPFERSYPMVGAHATLIDSILSWRFLSEAGVPVQILWYALFTLAGLLLFRRLEGRRLLLSGVGLICFNIISGILLFSIAGIVLPFTAPLLTLILLFLHYGLTGYIRESGEKRQVRAAFSLYLNPDLVDQVIRHPEKLRLGGEKKEVTVFFSDIEGFTSLSEGMDPEELVRLLNRYLTEVTDIILEEGGMLDKYEGDAVMAIFGAPLDLPDHAGAACRAAVRIQTRLKEMETEHPEAPPLRTRIGINTGTVVAGNMGSERRFDYTVMGDAVNLGSRLEGANKLYGTLVLVSDHTRRAAGDGFVFRELDRIRVKGRREPVLVHELIGHP